MADDCLPKSIAMPSTIRLSDYRCLLITTFLSLVSSAPFSSCLIFFWPYILNLLSFLSTLLAITALLILLAVSPPLNANVSLDSNSSISTTALLHRPVNAKSKNYLDCADGGSCNSFDDVKACETVFQVTEPAVGDDRGFTPREDSSGILISKFDDEIPVESEQEKEIWCETVTYYSSVEDEKVIEVVEEQGDMVRNRDLLQLGEVVGEQGDADKPSTESQSNAEIRNNLMSESIAQKHVTSDFKEAKNLKLSSSIGISASMRKEKEWKRTLACKLFEERHGGNTGIEGMDSLWEKHESDSNKFQGKHRSKSFPKKGCSDDDDDDDDFYGERDPSELCCLQALKFSSAKVNMGMRKPGLLKLSKAFKSFGWLHHPVRRSRKFFS